MAKTDYTHASIKQIDEAIAGGHLSLASARMILRGRAQRASLPGSNARAWLAAHGTPSHAPITPARVVAQVSTPVKAKKGKTADPAKKAAWATALRLCDLRGVDATGPNGGPTPEFWVIYRECRQPVA